MGRLMNVCRGIVLASAVMVLHLLFAQQNSGTADSRDYAPAVIAAGAYGMDEQNITVFPFDGEMFSIHLPFPLGRFAFSADGKILYAEATAELLKGRTAPRLKTLPASPRLERIEFNPMRRTPVAGSAGLGVIHSLAVSKLQGKLALSLGQPVSGEVGCGIFELSLQDGKIRRVIENPDCPPGLHNYLSAWLKISLSPDGRNVVAIRKRRLELIDLTQATVRVLGDGFAKAAWSPDGKWIAALEYRAEQWRTVLMDTSNFVVRRTLPNSDVEWSPDSRYLLGQQEDSPCEYNFGTLEAIDVENGRRINVDSSRCRANEATTAWVSSRIGR
jgi:WD40 repeat protein